MTSLPSRLALLAHVPLVAHAAAAAVIAGCAVVAARARKLLTGGLGARPRQRADDTANADDAELGRVLEARGLASASSAAAMSAREREFLLQHAAAALGPRGVLQPSRAASATPTLVRAAAAPAGVPDEARHAAPLSRIHCPACGAALGRDASAAFVAGCPRCGRRIAAHLEGTRLVLTVDDARPGAPQPGRPLRPTPRSGPPTGTPPRPRG